MTLLERVRQRFRKPRELVVRFYGDPVSLEPGDVVEIRDQDGSILVLTYYKDESLEFELFAGKAMQARAL